MRIAIILGSTRSGRIGEAAKSEEIARFVAYLLSPVASFFTSASLLVYGGCTASN